MNIVDLITGKDKYQRIWERDYRSFVRRLHLPKEATPTEVDDRIIEFLQEGKDLWRVRLTEDQRHNKDFMLRVWRANNQIVFNQSPSVELQNDLDLMIEYFKINIDACMNTYSRDLFSTTDHLKRITSRYKELMRNSEFVAKLATAFPEENILSILEYSLDDWKSIVDKTKGSNEVIEELPSEMIHEQVLRFGKDALSKISSKHPEYVNFVNSSVEHDGFKSLTYMPIDKLVENKDAVIKATEIDGVDALKRYLDKELTSRRTEFYMCHGEPHFYSYTDNRYSEAHDALVNDEDIRDILEDGDFVTGAM